MTLPTIDMCCAMVASIGQGSMGWYMCAVCAEARSVVVTQPNNKLSRVLKTMLKDLPAQMRAINAAGLASSLAMSDVAAAVAGPAAADAAREQLQRRLQMIRALQVGWAQLEPFSVVLRLYAAVRTRLCG